MRPLLHVQHGNAKLSELCIATSLELWLTMDPERGKWILGGCLEMETRKVRMILCQTMIAKIV